jgi:hypothetical protein
MHLSSFNSLTANGFMEANDMTPSEQAQILEFFSSTF